MKKKEVKAEEEVQEESNEEAVKIEAAVAAKKEGWNPKTSLGKKVKSGEIAEIGQILDDGLKIMEPEIVDILLPSIEADLLMIGQAKGKFGGGQKRVFNQTQKKTREGNKPSFSTYIVIGNKNGYVGVGTGKARETVPAREKAMRRAKLNIIKIRRGCGSWECGCKDPHTIPFQVSGKSGSAQIILMPAPKGTGLRIQLECQKILTMAGIKDIWSKSLGQTRTTTNLISACFAALKKLSSTKIQPNTEKELGIVEGCVKVEESA
ncbi:30S ribosomal protein S5 [Candidatus Woesearchaeota archaeon]|nr:30S ribosomal protein S5 [Candidatus Woesearchaeota archaeon]